MILLDDFKTPFVKCEIHTLCLKSSNAAQWLLAILLTTDFILKKIMTTEKILLHKGISECRFKRKFVL